MLQAAEFFPPGADSKTPSAQLTGHIITVKNEIYGLNLIYCLGPSH